MSLPSSEPLPDDINELPPARQRHLRRLPRTASPAEREILLESLLDLTGPRLDFFLLLILGSLASGAALYFNEPVLLILAIVTFPLLSPIFNLALLPPTLKMGQGVKALLVLAIAILLSFSTGVLTGWLAPSADPSRLAVLHFSAPYWLDAALVAGSTLLSCVIILRQDRLPHLAGALLSYEILLPLVLAGYGLMAGQAQLWPGALLTAGLHLGLALVVAVFTFALLGLVPDSWTGWLLALIPLALSMALLTATWFYHSQSGDLAPDPTATVMQAPGQTASPKAFETEGTSPAQPATATLASTPSPTATLLTLTATERTVTATITPAPTGYPAVVAAENGAVVREAPDFSSPVTTYVYDGEQITILSEITEGNTQWYEIETSVGEAGWLLGSLVNTPTPTPTSDSLN